MPQLIANRPTQAEFVDALTVTGKGWAAVQVIVLDVAAVMRLLDADGAPLDEMLVEPGTYELAASGGAAFKTNPALPDTPARIYAYATRPGEASFGGLAPADLTPIVGPKLDVGSVSIPSAGGSTTFIDRSPIPPTWKSVLLKLVGQGDPPGYKFTASWSAVGSPVYSFDFYADVGSGFPIALIALPIFGDELQISGHQTSGLPKSIGFEAWLANIEPFGLWSIGGRSLLAGWVGAVLAGGATLEIPLPLYAGSASIAAMYTGTSAGVTIDVRGFDDTGTQIATDVQLAKLVAATPAGQATFVLPPYRNKLRAFNNDLNAANLFVSVFAGGGA